MSALMYAVLVFCGAAWLAAIRHFGTKDLPNSNRLRRELDQANGALAALTRENLTLLERQGQLMRGRVDDMNALAANNVNINELATLRTEHGKLVEERDDLTVQLGVVSQRLTEERFQHDVDVAQKAQAEHSLAAERTSAKDAQARVAELETQLSVLKVERDAARSLHAEVNVEIVKLTKTHAEASEKQRTDAIASDIAKWSVKGAVSIYVQTFAYTDGSNALRYSRLLSEEDGSATIYMECSAVNYSPFAMRVKRVRLGCAGYMTLAGVPSFAGEYKRAYDDELTIPRHSALNWFVEFDVKSDKLVKDSRHKILTRYAGEADVVRMDGDEEVAKSELPVSLVVVDAMIPAVWTSK